MTRERLMAKSIMILTMVLLSMAMALSSAKAASSTSEATYAPLVWKVTNGGDAVVYLLGSFHFLTTDDYPLPSIIEAAYSDSDTVVFELSPEEMESPHAVSQMLEVAVRSDGSHLRDDIGDALFDRVERYAQAEGLGTINLANFKTWFVAMLISINGLNNLGFDSKIGLDVHLMQRSALDRKAAHGLETMATQIGTLDAMSIKAQQQMLIEALDQDADELRELHQAWQNGDLSRLEAMAVSMREEHPDLYRDLNVRRNNAWLPKVEQWLSGAKGSTLIVVGALHLVGPDSVIEQLRRRGYTIERQCANGSAVHRP